MSGPEAFEVDVQDWRVAAETARQVRVGSWFVYAEGVAPAGRLERLLARPAKARAVHAISGAAIELPGLRLIPKSRGLSPLACLVADRDLYRAGQDTVNLFCAVPGQAEVYGKSGLSIGLFSNGAPVSRRELDLGREGTTVEAFVSLMAGRYEARLLRGGSPLGPEAAFTVAEYSLAPLSGRLRAHRLERGTGLIHFELEVESYQVPFDRELDVALVDAGRELSSTRLGPRSPGLYAGQVTLAGVQGPLRLRLTAASDASRIAEVALPGSRQQERDTTRVSELGREVLFSLMPEAEALPVRGGYLTQGDFLATPLTVDRVDAAEGVLRAQVDLESLTLVVVDLATGQETVIPHGDVPAGRDITVPPSAICSVFAGAWAGGQPFEGFTSFFRPSALRVQVAVPASVRPGDEVPIRISCPAPADAAASRPAVPVLLCVRDQRLTATDTPETALAASAKKAVGEATAGMAHASFRPLLLAMAPEDGPDLAIMLGPPPMATRPVRASAQRPAMAAPTSRGRGGLPGVPPTGSFSLRAILGRLSQPAPEALGPDDLAGGLDLGAVAAGLDAPGPQAGGVAPRADFPEVLFYGVVPVTGDVIVRVPAGDALGTFAVEAFALAGGDWAQERASFVVDQPVRADLDLPPAVHPGDRVTGRLRVGSSSGRAFVRLSCDGAPVELPGVSGDAVATPLELSFAVRAGLYAATVEDAATGERDHVEVRVDVPGKFRSVVREVGLLQTGDTLTLDSAGALSLRVLPGLDAPFKQLVQATAGYGHLCCEQTAAKVLAACVMWLTAEGPAAKARAEAIIVAGIAREKTMWRRGLGFSMYPEYTEVNTHWGALAVRHLWSLASLDGAAGVSRALAEAVREGLAMADDVAGPLKVQRIPERITSLADAFAAARGPAGARRDARARVDADIDLARPEPRLRKGRDRVHDRAALCHGAAVLLALGEVADGVRAANVVTRQLNEEGRLYSTVDSAAAIALFGELLKAGILAGTARLKVNGREMGAREAALLSDQVETVEVLSGVAPVEVSRIHEEDWTRFSADLPVRIGFRGTDGGRTGRFRMGDRVDLQVELPRGYQAGDLVHVALPASLSWIEGGGRVKRFTRDFEGRSSLSVPLVVTGDLDGKQHFAVCVRNMFEEERAASPGLLSVGA